jgi:predicted NBD/HSP70 family sugar kinase
VEIHVRIHIRRFRAADVRHVAIAGALCKDVTLFHLLGRRALLDSCDDVVTDRLRRGIAFLARKFEPDVFFIGGGMTERATVRACIEQLPTSRVVLSRDGRFVGELGGRSIGGASAVIFDMGQTAIKVSRDGVRRVYDRPPPEMGPDGCDLAGIAFIKQVVSTELAAAGPGARGVLAVPGDVRDDLTPGPSNYRWQGRTGFLRELLPPDGDYDVLVLNDAELAAESARLEVEPSTGGVFVVTLGHAPGGALLTRRAST